MARNAGGYPILKPFLGTSRSILYIVNFEYTHMNSIFNTHQDNEILRIYKGFSKMAAPPPSSSHIQSSWMTMSHTSSTSSYGQASGDLGAGSLLSGSHIRWGLGFSWWSFRFGLGLATYLHISFILMLTNVCCSHLCVLFFDGALFGWFFFTYETCLGADLGRKQEAAASSGPAARCWHCHWSAHYAMGARDSVGPLGAHPEVTGDEGNWGQNQLEMHRCYHIWRNICRW